MIHDPDLAAIDAVTDPAIRHYAAVGAVITLAGQIDYAMSAAFRAAIGDDAENRFFGEDFRSTATKRDALDAVMRARGAPTDWAALFPELVAVTTPQGPQNPARPSVVHEGSSIWLEGERLVIQSVFESRVDDVAQSTADLLARAARQQKVKDQLYQMAATISARV